MKTVLFVGGGTAGHVMPNLALIDELNGECACVYAGGSGMERSLCISRGITFYDMPSVKLRRDSVIKNAALPFRLAACVSKAKKLLKDIKPDLVFSKGGYVALPAALAAGPLGIPLIAHESDYSPGLVTKICKKRAKRLLCAFEPCAKALGGEYVGAPLRRDIYRAPKDAKKLFGADGKKPLLLIMGGSSGAAELNAVTLEALPALLEKFYVVHLTGKGKEVAYSGSSYTQLPFCDDMGALYTAADVAVTRAGANALFELAARGVPALAVPLERASRGDQIQNAEFFEAKGAVKVLRSSRLTPATLIASVSELYDERQRYIDALAAFPADGTKRICDIIREELG